MLNYIWSGLIIISLVFALIQDSYDLSKNTYKNGKEYSVEVTFPTNKASGKKQPVRVYLPQADTTIKATWNPTSSGTEIIMDVTGGLPDHWQTVAENKKGDEPNTLRAEVVNPEAGGNTYRIVLPEVKFVKLRAITTAAFDMAEFAVQLAIGLIGVMALWLGLMKIAEESGMIKIINRMVRPVLRWLFPDIPKDHPALSAISLNMAANVLGLGNAATPLGIKAMEELQTLNDDEETATDAMCMFLAINTSSVQLLPPVTLVALMGVAVNELMISIIAATTVSTIAGIAAAKWLAWRHRKPTQPQSST